MLRLPESVMTITLADGALLLKHCRYVVTPVPGRYTVRVLEDVDIAIENGIIVCIGRCRSPGADEIDCRNYVAMPAMGNAHSHAAMSILRGYADDYELFPWLERIWRAEKLLTPEAVYHASRIGAIEMAMSGIAALQDMYFYPLETARAATEIGLRIRTGPIAGLDPLDLSPYTSLSRTNPLYTPVINLHSLYVPPHEVIEQVFEMSKNLGIDVHMHVSETREEVFLVRKKYGFFPVEYLYRRGWLSRRCVLVHLNWLTSWEIDLVAEVGARGVLCPTSCAKLATGGFAPVYEMMGRGIALGLGSDGASANRFSIAREMLHLVLLYRHNYWDTRIRAEHALYMATYGSYEAMSLRGGAIEIGYLGDIVLIDLRNPWMFPPIATRIVSHLVYTLEQSDIVYTIVGGRVVWSYEMKDRMLKLIEESEKALRPLIDRVEEVRKELSEAYTDLEPPEIFRYTLERSS